MRLWSLHPKFLDSKGLVALWREALLAQKVLLGKTKGYRHHPQLERFKMARSPARAIAGYLFSVHREALRRGYHFDSSKINGQGARVKIPVTAGQIEYEMKHLLGKCRKRDRGHFQSLSKVVRVDVHPLFRVVAGPVAEWERV